MKTLSSFRKPAAFSLVELLVSTAILLIIMVMLLQVTGTIANIWKTSSGKISAFQNGRAAFATIRDTISRATLNTYNDYVNSGNQTRTDANAATFVPSKFARASELHFICGPTATIVADTTPENNPGDAIFFQAPMGYSANTDLAGLGTMINSTGFYLQYGTAADSLLPTWLESISGNTKRFRLMQFVEDSANLQVYTSTATGNYTAEWLKEFKPNAESGPRARILAEDIPLLIFLPRLSENATINASWLSPDYLYDSRAWQSGYPKTTGTLTGNKTLMRNQVPPIIEVIMVAVDRLSLARFDLTSATPPTELQVPTGLFIKSEDLEDDLDTYTKQLADARIRYRIFRTSVPIKSSKWQSN